jgi:hypothetical protein
MVERDSGRDPDTTAAARMRGRFRPPAGVESCTVTDPEQARILTSPASVQLFLPFLARERTVNEVAKETGRELNAVLYRVRTYLSAGLLEVVREIKRPGRAVKVYRSVHDAYYVPYEVTPFATLEERMIEQTLPAIEERVRAQARALLRSGRWGQSLYRDETGEVWTSSSAGAAGGDGWHDPRGGIDFWTEVWLSSAEAEELRSTLYEALERFGHRPTDGGPASEPDLKRFHFSVAVVPLEE